MPAAHAPSRVGEIIGGKYKLVARLAVGGMGEVYRAMNLAAARPVALKLLRRELLEDDLHVRRFMREGRAANRARHPNILEVLDVDRDEQGNAYIVQDLLEGEDLRRRLKRRGGKLPLGEALEVLIPVAQAVAAAHAVGLVHRDLKPPNVFLARSPGGGDVPKVLDFGIAKIVETDEEGNTPLTNTDVAVGTPAYMAPEQIKTPKTVDARADVWALGVLIHRVMSGELPFDADTPGALMVAVCTEEPVPLDQHAPDAPEALVALVRCCLEKDVDARFADASAVARALASIAEDLAEHISAQRVRADSAPKLEPMPGDSMPSPVEWELETPPPSVPRPNSSKPVPSSRPPNELSEPSLPAFTPADTDPPAASERRPVRELRLPATTSAAPDSRSASMRPAVTSVSNTRVRAPRDLSPAAMPLGDARGIAEIAGGVVVGAIALMFSWGIRGPTALHDIRDAIGQAGALVLAAILAGAGVFSWRRSDNALGMVTSAGLCAVAAMHALTAWSMRAPSSFEMVQAIAPWTVVVTTLGLATHGVLKAKALRNDAQGIALVLFALSLLGGYAALRLAF